MKMLTKIGLNIDPSWGTPRTISSHRLKVEPIFTRFLLFDRKF